MALHKLHIRMTRVMPNISRYTAAGRFVHVAALENPQLIIKEGQETVRLITCEANPIHCPIHAEVTWL